MVRVVRLERTVSWSQTRRDTNFAIPGYSLFCHDTTARGKNKVFSVCGHLCGQSRFCAVFGNRVKSRKRRCRKALRRFALPRPGYRHGTPKAGALPAALHPVIEFFIRLGVFSQTRRDTNFAIPGYLLSIAQLSADGKRKFLVYINKVVIGGRLPADDDLIQICIKRLACCALRQREGDIRAEKVGVDGQVEAAALQLHQAAGDG